MTAWGLLSTARINAKILDAARASETADAVAVASRDANRARAYADEHGIQRSHGSYQALLADPGVDAVYVSLPNHLHVEWSIKALEAGKHVLCEKPFSRRPREVARAFELAESKGLVLSEGFMWRHTQVAQRLVELVEGGAIGRVQTIRAHLGFELDQPLTGLRRRVARLRGRSSGPADVRLSPDFDGGALMDVGCYCVSVARLLAGEPSTATATFHRGPTGVDVAFAGTLEFDDGAVAELTGSFLEPFRSELEVIGESGLIRIDDPFLGSASQITIVRNGQTETVDVAPENAYQLELEDVSAAIARGGAPRLGRADALGQAEAIDALFRAAERGTAVPVGRPLPVTKPLGPRPEQPMRFGSIEGVDKPVSRLVMGILDRSSANEVDALLDAFFEQGGNAFDTAWLYGRGLHERLLGDWIASRGVLDDVVVISKGAHTPLNTPEHAVAHLHESLERLKLDRLDLYLLHRDNEEIPVGEFVDVLDEQRRAGTIGAFGVSNWSIDRVAAANAYADANGRARVSVLSNQFSLARMVRPPFDGCVSAADDRSRAWLTETQTPLLAWSSQARGFFARAHAGSRARLAASVKTQPRIAALHQRAAWHLGRTGPDPAEIERVRSWYSDDNFARLDRARELGARLGVPPISVALAYVLAQPFPTFTVIGPRGADELRPSIDALALELDTNDLRRLDLTA